MVMDNLDRLAVMAIRNEGALITGPPGTSKTEFLKKVKSWLHRLHPQDTVTVMAPTHAVARLAPEGGTIAHVMHTKLYGKVQGQWLFVDEVSMVSASLGPTSLVGSSCWGPASCFLGTSSDNISPSQTDGTRRR